MLEVFGISAATGHYLSADRWRRAALALPISDIAEGALFLVKSSKERAEGWYRNFITVFNRVRLITRTRFTAPYN
jgi:hypothetical protein